VPTTLTAALASLRLVCQVKIRAHLPTQHHIQRIEFPRHLTDVGHHVVHFMWRGYTGCVDVHVLSDNKPVQNTSREMVGYRVTGPDKWHFERYDHTAFDIGSYHLSAMKIGSGGVNGRGCHMVPPPGERNSAGQTHEEAFSTAINLCRSPPRRQTCQAVQCVPLVKPPLVRFPERNIPIPPYGPAASQCARFEELAASEPAGTQVCYGASYMGDVWASRDNWGPHDGRATEPWTTSEDPREYLRSDSNPDLPTAYALTADQPSSLLATVTPSTRLFT